MAQTLLAEKVTLYDLEQQFGLQRQNEPQAFAEWQVDLPELQERDREQLDRVRENYIYLSTRPMLEEMVKMVVVSPLLDLAGFYRPPFFPVPERSVKVSSKDETITIRGKIDILVLKERLWVLVIESKQLGLSLQPGIPQALSYMLASPNQEHPVYGMVTNGNNFVFLKLVQQDVTQYASSDEFVLGRGNDLYTVLQVLKHLAQLLAIES